MSLDPELRTLFSDFAVDVTVGGVPCRGIFDEAYAETLGMVAGSSPALLLPTTIAAVQDAAVTIGARNFTVASVEPDGTGFQRLQLEAA